MRLQKKDERVIESLSDLILHLWKEYLFMPDQLFNSDNCYEEIKSVEYCSNNVMKFEVVDKDGETHIEYLSDNDMYNEESGLFEYLIDNDLICYHNYEWPNKIIFHEEDLPEFENDEPVFWAMYMASLESQKRFSVLKEVIDLKGL